MENLETQHLNILEKIPRAQKLPMQKVRLAVMQLVRFLELDGSDNDETGQKADSYDERSSIEVSRE